jgi:hypothetical protein
MIFQNEYWYDVVPSSGLAMTPIAGKWLYFDETEKLHALLDELNTLVESGEIPAAKIARKLPGVDPFPEKQCVLCVFTSGNKAEKERIKNVLEKKLAISVKVWKSEEQTRRDWEEGGWLRVQSEISKLRRVIESGKVDDVHVAQKRMLGLSEQLEAMLKEVDDPGRKAEVDLNRIHEVNRKTGESLLEQLGMPEVVSRLKSLEDTVTAVMSKFESGDIGYDKKPKPSSSNTVFIIMPFADEYVDTHDTIKRAILNADPNLEPERVDEKPGAISITDEIHRSIQNACLVICDLTNERPNVYYELGFAKGISKPLICIAKEGTQIHFDVYGLKTIFFRTYRDLEQKLSTEIKKMCEKNTNV